MKQKYIFAFGNNPHGKTVPDSSAPVIREPEDIFRWVVLHACSAVSARKRKHDDDGDTDYVVQWTGWAESMVSVPVENCYVHMGYSRCEDSDAKWTMEHPRKTSEERGDELLAPLWVHDHADTPAYQAWLEALTDRKSRIKRPTDDDDGPPLPRSAEAKADAEQAERDAIKLKMGKVRRARLVELANVGSDRRWLGHDRLEGFETEAGEVVELRNGINGVHQADLSELNSTGDCYKTVVLATGQIYALLNKGMAPGRTDTSQDLKRLEDNNRKTKGPIIRKFASLSAMRRGQDCEAIAWPADVRADEYSIFGSGSSHALIHVSHPSYALLGLGDNRFGAALPRDEAGSSDAPPPSQLNVPARIPFFDGIAIDAAFTGGNRSGAISEAGEAWMWGRGIDGIEKIVVMGIPRGKNRAEECDIKLMGIGEDYEVVVTEENLVFVRGKNDLGQLGLPEDVLELDEFTLHPFFVEKKGGGKYNVTSLVCSRWSTFLNCKGAE